MSATPSSTHVEVFLKPGEYVVAGPGHRFRTVLGSCISMTLWSPHRRVGAMSHFLLPTRGRGRVDATRGLALRALDGRYGDEALQLMLHELDRLDVRPAQCEAKIFGGGDMFPGRRRAGGPLAVGRRNGEAARELLQSHGIAVVSESLFGDGHRQIAFDVDSGDVWVRQLPPEASK